MRFNYSEGTLGERFMVIVVYPLEGFTVLAAPSVAINRGVSAGGPAGPLFQRRVQLGQQLQRGRGAPQAFHCNKSPFPNLEGFLSSVST